MKKRIMALGIAAIMVVASGFAFSACSKNKDAKKDSAEPAVSSSADEIKETPKEEAPADKAVEEKSVEEKSADAPKVETAPAQTAPEETKYGDAEVYTNDNGKPAAKTESGVEVELTGENMGKLLEDYQKVQGSGSEEEKALLDQIQVILEATQGQNVEAE